MRAPITRTSHYLFSLGMFLLVAFAASVTPSQADAQTAGWCTAGAGCFPSPTAACQAQFDVGPTAGDTFLGERDDAVYWYSKQCMWTWIPGTTLPATVGFSCASGNPRPPGQCIDSNQDFTVACEDPCGCGNPPAKTPWPIDILTGSKIFEATDFETADGSLRLRRVYASLPYGGMQTTTALVSPPLGLKNWHYDFQYEIQIGLNWASNNLISLVTPTGGVFSFQRQSDGSLIPFVITGPPQTDYTLSFDGSWPSNLNDLINASSSWILTDPQGTAWHLTTAVDPISGKYRIARPSVMKTRNGLQWNFQYNYNYQLTSITDSYGKQITFDWLWGDPTTQTNGTGPIFTLAVSAAHLPNGDTITYEYDTLSTATSPLPLADRLKRVKYIDASSVQRDKTTYEYGNSSFPLAITGILDLNDVERWTVAYDSSGRATTSAGPGGVDSYTVSYGTGSSFTRTVTNPLGKVETYNYTGALLTGVSGTASANTPSSTTSISYSGGFMSSFTDEEGRVTHFAYNSRGLPTQIVEAYGTSAARTTNYTWHSTLRVPTQIQQPNLTTDYIYDTQGRLTSLTQTDTTSTSVPYWTYLDTRTWAYTWSGTGQLLTVDGPLNGSGDTVTYTYSTNGYLATITNELSQVTTINAVNGRGQPTQITDPNSVETDLAYDALGRLTSITVNPGTSQAVTAFEYNAVGDATKITAPNSAYLQYTYNSARRVTEITNNLGEKIDYTYNDAGSVTQTNVKTSGSTLVATRSKTYDELNRVLHEIGAASQTTAYTYDKVGNRKTVTDPRSKLYSYGFDALNRLTQETDPDSYQTNIAYNGKDETSSVTDARSLQTSYVRNGFGDVIRRTSPDTGITDFWYDAAGHMIKTVDARGIETDFTVDLLGRTQTKLFPAASIENVTYVYDQIGFGNFGIGRLISTSEALGNGNTSFFYNRLGQIWYEQKFIQGIIYNIAYTYDASGNILQITYPSGRIVNYTRDSVGRITGITTKANSGASAVTITSSGTYKPFGPLAGFTFGNSVALTMGYDQDSQLTSIQSSYGGTTVQNLSYGHDNSGNITSITDNYQSARSQTLGYDNLNRLNSASGAYGSLSFTYDGVGNRSTRVVGGTTETFNYSSTSNRLTGTTISGSAGRTLSYANSGEVSQDVRGGSTTYGYTYNKDGRLASASLNSSTVGTYVYNGLEQRVAKTAASTTTHYVFDRAGHLMSEDDASGNPIREYLWLDSLPVAMVDHTGMSAVIYYIHTDHLGKPQKMTNGSVSLVWDVIFQPFGEAYSASGTATNLLMFPGQFYDSETALAQNWSRDYDATLGRYIQSDPIDLAGGINTYAYVEENPLIYADPTGLGKTGVFIKTVKGLYKQINRGSGADRLLKGEDLYSEGPKASKQAKQLSEEAFGKKSIRHDPHKEGWKPHYQNKNGRGGHSFYNFLIGTSFVCLYGDNPLAQLLDFFNPWQDIKDTIDLANGLISDDDED